MFNNEAIIFALQHFLINEKLQPEEVILGFGGACVMHGVRQYTNDIDISVAAPVFAILKDSGLYELKHFAVGRHKRISVEYGGGISVHMHLDGRDSENSVMVDGVCCYSIRTTLAYKQMLNREKDQADIEALKNLLKGNS